MPVSYRLSDLAAMTPAEQEVALDVLVAATRASNGTGSAVLNARIRRFEERYEMPSDEMLRRLASGTLEETAEIAEWLFLLDARQPRAAR